MLPESITTQEVREVSDEFDWNEVEDLMSLYIDELVDRLVEKHKLDSTQAEELAERIGWRLELFPKQD